VVLEETVNKMIGKMKDAITQKATETARTLINEALE